jgi:hypothetical protein
MPPIEPSHGDILVQIGQLQGQMTTLITLMNQKREELNAASLRLNSLEKDSATHIEVGLVATRVGIVERELAKWAGICVAIACLMPLVMPQLQRALGVIEDHPTQQQHSPPARPRP